MSGTVNERYSPKSDFLCMVANDEVPLTGSDTAKHNLRLLIGFTHDPDVSNRDWAPMLLAQQEIDTPEVRHSKAWPSGIGSWHGRWWSVSSARTNAVTAHSKRHD